MGYLIVEFIREAKLCIRPIICYVTHAVSWGWDKDYINCCNTFFTANNIEERLVGS